MSRAAFVDDLLGTPYDQRSAHCWWLTGLVQRVVFGRILPGADDPLPAPRDRAGALRDGVAALGWREHPAPEDGDVVMMSRLAGGPQDHVGTFLADRRGVLHTDTWHGVVIDTLTELRQLRRWHPHFYRPDR
ncbi:glycoside hydrolase [Enterovirga rhinocerotis]|uniref:NlpC/P60 family protein n=1 Tax=Enterovirga rhinocerotis TaxID=1339210 RepID=A0A4R7C6J2_9HYPH|nr:glycoside hydrolase [Enterovirga rhinocerotis]TDR94210.1 hypothetical protein EV668_1490 [Enterovirga rhinocerotis]